MTREQKDKAIAIVKEDANYAFYYCKEGKTCVIGGLLKSLGTTDEKLKGLARAPICIFSYYQDLLYHNFGLTPSQQIELQSVNDFTCLVGMTEEEKIENPGKPELVELRRKALIEKIESFE